MTLQDIMDCDEKPSPSPRAKNKRESFLVKKKNSIKNIGHWGQVIEKPNTKKWIKTFNTRHGHVEEKHSCSTCSRENTLHWKKHNKRNRVQIKRDVNRQFSEI